MNIMPVEHAFTSFARADYPISMLHLPQALIARGLIPHAKVKKTKNCRLNKSENSKHLEKRRLKWISLRC
jgi:hypothetical protein